MGQPATYSYAVSTDPPPYSPPTSQTPPINDTTYDQRRSGHHTTNMENVENNFGNSFTDKAIRRAFIRKVRVEYPGVRLPILLITGIQ